MTTSKKTITLKEGFTNGNSGYIEIYNNGKFVECIKRGIPTLNNYFRGIENKIDLVINETMYCFPNNLPFNFKIKDNK